MSVEIVDGLNQLRAEAHALLHATYTSSGRDLVDTENVLFYNVSTTPFARLTKDGLRFERSFRRPPARPDGAPADHHHSYLMQPWSSSFALWTVARTLGTFETARIRCINTSTRCRDVWAGVRAGDQHGAAAARPNEPIAVRLELVGRPADVSAAAGALKPLFDGVIAAFQAHDGTAEDEMSGRLLGTSTGDRAQIRRWLRNRDHSVLGSSQLVRARGVGVQFYPADDLCVAGEIRVRVSPDGPSPPVLSGELLGVSAAALIRD